MRGFVHPLVCRSVVIELKGAKMHICDWLSVCGVGVGVDGGFMPLPTRLQRYCNHASLVVIIPPIRSYTLSKSLFR